MEKSIVRPIFKKKGSPSNPLNYRPISLLPCLSKIHEKIIFNHIYTHITTNQLLSDKQSGYRPKHSTQLQLTYLTQNLYKSLDDKNDFTAIYLDISRYFDTIWHDGLLSKCKNEFNISGTLLNWINSYLTHREQKVSINNALSTLQSTNAGVPQGSVLGPLLALIFLNGLSDVTTNDVLFYTDDTSLYAPHTDSDLDTVQDSLQHDLDAIHDYGQRWKIKFNPSKTIQQTFTLKNATNHPRLKFAAEPIPVVATHKHLGLTFSSDLKFHEHANDILKKVNKALSPLYPVARYLSRETLNQIYHLYVLPHFDYCDVIYDGPMTVTDELRLERTQNRAARLVTGAKFRTPSDLLKQDLGWNSLTTRRKIHKLTFYRTLTTTHQALPGYIETIITDTRQNDAGRILRNALARTLPPNRTTLYQRSFIPSVTKQWNDLPENIKTQTTPKSFKTALNKLISTPKPPLFFGLGNKQGNTLHTRLRLGMTDLNVHNFQIQKTDDPACACGFPLETVYHFILICPKYDQIRAELFNNISQTIDLDFSTVTSTKKLDIILRGYDLNVNQSCKVAEAFQKYIGYTNRFR